MLVCAVLLAGVWATFGGFSVTARTHTRAESQAVINDATPLLAAIHKYEGVTGRPPPILAALAPKYITRLPALPSRYASGRDYLYTVEPNQWRLAVPLRGERNAVLTYSSVRDYPSGNRKTPVVRIGDWAYYHGNPYAP